MFQFALPRGERHHRTNGCSDYCAFQFALPRGERHWFPIIGWLGVMVSIRAPAWGATAVIGNLRHLVEVSIRAPAWGSDGGALFVLYEARVSIRAPAWGATLSINQENT